jgi:hypothetical protein
MRYASRFSTVLSPGLAVAGMTCLALVVLRAQPNEFQFIVGAVDGSGSPVTDLKRDEVVMTEDGAEAMILKVEPYRVPVKLTLAVDNGPDSGPALSHYRSGLTGLVSALPFDVEVTLITTAPQPRMVVRPTTDRERLKRGITGFAPDSERPRFTDALVEYSKRLQREMRNDKPPDSLPIIVMISTTANEVSDYQPPEIEKALTFLARRKARLMVAITSTTTGNVAAVADINTNRQAMIAIPAVKATRGRYEPLAVSTRLATLLPEMGREIADLHARHVNQFRVTVARANDATGPFRNLQVALTRPGVTGTISADGLQ